jgi:prepilin-type processing-associated H-X9-DG protein
MRTHRAGYRAFTTVELLTVIAIIAILMALLLPAVQYMRERARQTQCLNNLKNIGLAIHQHNGAFQTFPTAGGFDAKNTPDNWDLQRCDANIQTRVRSKWQDWGWAYQILPYLQKQATFNSPFANYADGAKHTEWVIPAYFCPSRARTNLAPTGQGCGMPTSLTPGPRPTIDYAGNGGYRNKVSVGGSWKYTMTNNMPDIFPFPDPRCVNFADGAIIPGKRPIPNPSGAGLVTSYNPYNHDLTGPVQSEEVAMGGIPDGTSTTILVGERRFNRGWDLSVGVDPAEDNGYVAGYTWDTIRWGYVVPTSDANASSATTPAEDSTKFGATHTSTCNFVFCDGSVRQVNYQIELDAFRAQCSRNDGTLGAAGKAAQ